LRDELDSDWVWQSSHIGGDRFAGNLVCLPEGLYYGRVDRETAGTVLDEHLGSRIDLEHYRGRSCYGFPVQAAERFVRERDELLGVHDLRLKAVEREGDAWLVSFEGAGAVRVEPTLGDLTLLTCSDQAAKRPRRFAVSPA